MLTCVRIYSSNGASRTFKGVRMGLEDKCCRICECFLREDGQCSNPHCSTHRTTVRAPEHAARTVSGFSHKPTRKISYRDLVRRKKKLPAGVYTLLELEGAAVPPPPLVPELDIVTPETSGTDDEGDRPTPVEVPVARDEMPQAPENAKSATRTHSGMRKRACLNEVIADLDKEKAGNG